MISVITCVCERMVAFISLAGASRFSLVIFGSDKMQLEDKTADRARVWFLAFQVGSPTAIAPLRESLE